MLGQGQARVHSVQRDGLLQDGPSGHLRHPPVHGDLCGAAAGRYRQSDGGGGARLQGRQGRVAGLFCTL